MTERTKSGKKQSIPSRKLKRPGRNDTLDADKERERLEPGSNTDGTGGVGADPRGYHEDSNSNT